MAEAGSRGTMTYAEFPPPARLRSVVECLWFVRDARARGSRPVEHVIPDGCPELIVHRADPFARLVGGRWRRQPRAFLVGALTRPWRLRPGSRVLTLGIRFRPAAVSRLVACDLARATDREVPLERLFERERVAALRAALECAADGEALVTAARRWLLTLPVAAPAAVATRAVRALLVSRGRLRIAELTERLAISRRRLERNFERHVGLRPKLFARIVRLQAALATLDAAERDGAVAWALDAGYFDQAHQARDFRTLAGRPAMRSRDADGEMARHFTDPERLLALLAGE